jgi:hypothetical protein
MRYLFVKSYTSSGFMRINQNSTINNHLFEIKYDKHFFSIPVSMGKMETLISRFA